MNTLLFEYLHLASDWSKIPMGHAEGSDWSPGFKVPNCLCLYQQHTHWFGAPWIQPSVWPIAIIASDNQSYSGNVQYLRSCTVQSEQVKCHSEV